jgi:hypothetical protein
MFCFSALALVSDRMCRLLCDIDVFGIALSLITHESPNVSLSATFVFSALFHTAFEKSLSFDVPTLLRSLVTLHLYSTGHCVATTDILHHLISHGLPSETFDDMLPLWPFSAATRRTRP